MGPLQYLVIGFNGNHFTGEILPELRSLRERQIIRMLDLVFISRDAQGSITRLELNDSGELAEAMAGELDQDPGDWFADKDIDEVGQSLPPETSVALVLIEHLWAEKLKQKIVDANGSLILEGMIPHEVVSAVEVELQGVS